jgi:hypothetical protein
MNLAKKISAIGAGWMLALICLGSFGMMLSVARTDSAIMDELAHIPAGYSYVHNFDYRLNPEHPPLIKALAALPVLFLNPVFPTATDAWQNQVNAQWNMGYEFLYASGNDANAIIETARLFPILITILTIILIYLLARRIMGERWALVPAFLFAFDPTVLAHGHYVTTDVGAAFGVLLALFFFLQYTEAPTTRNLWFAGLAFGVAMVCKFSTPLLIPLFIFLTLAVWVREMARRWNEDAGKRFKRFGRDFLARFWKLILIGVIGFVFIVYPIYFLFTVQYPVAKQVSDTTAILTSFANGPTPAGQVCHSLRCLADLDVKMASNPILRPFAEYTLGILMVLQRADGGNTIYFMGQVVGAGGPIYFPLLYILKEPIPTLLIVFFALLLAIWWTAKALARNSTAKKDWLGIMHYLDTSFTEFSLASFIILYWGYSIQSQLNIGLRHIMPTLPFIAILAAVVWRKWVTRFNFPALHMKTITSFATAAMRSIATRALKYLALIILLAWLFLETLIAAPYFLSYFNEFGGGTMNGYHWVTDSNYDWGQDLLRLQSFIGRHPEIDKIAVDYFGGGNPAYALGTNKEVDWSPSKGDPSDQGIHWLAVSVNTLESATQPLGPGQHRNASDTYAWLVELRPPQSGMGNVPPPDYRVGTSIFVYHL